MLKIVGKGPAGEMGENRSDTGNKKNPVLLGSYTEDAFKKLGNRADPPLRSSRVGDMTYGFDGLDWMTNGIHSDDFIVIAGRSSMGKTDLLLNIAGKIAKTDGPMAVVFFSMKLSAEQIHTRFVCSSGEVRRDNWYTGTLEVLDWPRIVRASANLHDAPFFIDDSPVTSLDTLRQKITTLQAERKIGLVVIDSLQHLSDVKDENNAGQVAHLSRSTKALARELQVPILASVHVSRSAQSRFDRRPTIEDLDTWESVTEYADVVGFLHAGEMYSEFTVEDPLCVPIFEDLDESDGMEEYVHTSGFFPLRWINTAEEDGEERRLFECVIRKNINGVLGTVSLLYEPVYHRFSEANITAEEPVEN